ncbi:MAG: integrase arm-type DNA-binding domain-containing protein [Rhodospirillales bacterium]|jgi:integrase|nr:integrase arm-type DNA-binding domain-containing protein [Rhodospirillales bacterium]
MAAEKLTDKKLKNLKAPKTGRFEVWDQLVSDDRTLPGTFGIRVTRKGAKSWVIMYRTLDAAKGKIQQKRLKIGSYPAMSLAEARKAARDTLLDVSKGTDPAKVKQAARAELLGAITFGDALNQFIDKYAKRETRGWKETSRVFDKYVKPDLGDYRLDAVTTLQIRDLVEAKAETAPYMANRMLAYLRKFFNWASERDMVDASPVSAIKPPGKENARDRILNDGEIRLAWNAFDKMGWPFGHAFTLLLITGQRRDEVTKMRWKDIDEKECLWTLPREATKADRLHEVPLSDLAVEILQSVPRTSNEFVFSTNGKTPISGFSKAKAKADKTAAFLQLQADGQDRPCNFAEFLTGCIYYI